MVGVGAMALIIAAFLAFCIIQLNVSYKNLSELKVFIHEQATNGSSQILVQNVMSRELLNKQYLFDGNARNKEIIGLLESEFNILSNDLSVTGTRQEQQAVKEFIAQDNDYKALIKNHGPGDNGCNDQCQHYELY